MKIEKNAKVLITGAASGIGRSTAIAMAERGCITFLTDRNSEGLDETVRMIADAGGQVGMHRAFDISDLEAVKAFASDIHKDHGPMDIVMNIAGIALFALIEDMDHSHWQKVININLWGPIHVIECFLPEMIKVRRGHLVNVSSSAGLSGAPLHAAYSSAKWGLVGLSEVLRYDLMQHNLGVTVVCPGAVETPLKDTVEILGVDNQSPRVIKMKKMFSEHAVTPECVADQIIRAIEKNKFLILTSWDVRLIYFCKRHAFPLYHYVMKRISRMLNSMRYPREGRRHG